MLTQEGRELFFAMYGLTPEDADLIKNGFVLYQNPKYRLDEDEFRWSKTPLDGWLVVRDSIIPKTMYVPKFGRDYNRRLVRVDTDGGKVLNGR